MRWHSKSSISTGGVLLWCLFVVLAAPAQTPQGPLSLERLACMNWCELEQLYRQAPPGAIPAGYLRGRAIFCPDAILTPARERMARALWHGKHFYPDQGILVNQWCLGVQAVRARVCYGESLLDGQPSIVMDYRGMGDHVWKHVRDEIREIAPGVYLGRMYQCRKGQPRLESYFALERSPCGH